MTANKHNRADTKGSRMPRPPTVARASMLLLEGVPGAAALVHAAVADSDLIWNVEVVRSLQEAFGCLDVARYDCLLVNLELAKADAAGIVEALRERARESTIVVLSEHCHESLAGLTIRAGADDFVLRDSQSAVQLNRTIQSALEGRHSRYQLRRMSDRYDAVLSALDDALIVLDGWGRIESANLAATRMLATAEAELVGQHIDTGSWTFLSCDGGQPLGSAAPISSAMSAGLPATGTDVGVRNHKGDVAWVQLNMRPLTAVPHCPPGAVVSMRDVGAQRNAEQNARFQAALLDSLEQAVTVTDPRGGIVFWNAAAEAMYGWSAQEAIGRSARDLVASEESAAQAEQIGGALLRGEGWTGEFMVRGREGTTIPALVTNKPVTNSAGDLTAIISISTDLTAHKAASEKTPVLAAPRVTRAIGDRRGLERELACAMRDHASVQPPDPAPIRSRHADALVVLHDSEHPVTVLLMTLDPFETADGEDRAPVMDQVRKEVNRRLSCILRPSDSVARIGETEFVIVCDGTNEAEAERVALRITSALTLPMTARGERLTISATIAISASTAARLDASPVPRLPGARGAGASGRARRRVSDRAGETNGKLDLTSELRAALEQNHLDMHYQPVVDLVSGHLVGIEALIRWEHPLRGWIPPHEFVPLAEQSGNALALDSWALSRACRDAMRMRANDQLPLDARLAVNVSAHNLSDPRMVDIVRDVVSGSGLPFHVLELEVTETAILTDPVTARDCLTALGELGVDIALDDFGTGYSSLAYLRQLPVRRIKIDRSFVQQINERPDDLAISASIIDLARALDLATTAEGIETTEQLAVLRKLGCAAGQGTLWSPALPMTALAETLGRHSDGFDVTPPAGPRQSASRPTAAATNEHGLHRIRQLHSEGASPATIAAAINTEGFRAPSGLRWHRSSVAREIAGMRWELAGSTRSS